MYDQGAAAVDLFRSVDRLGVAVVLRTYETGAGCHVADAKGNAFGNLDLTSFAGVIGVATCCSITGPLSSLRCSRKTCLRIESARALGRHADSGNHRHQARRAFPSSTRRPALSDVTPIDRNGAYEDNTGVGPVDIPREPCTEIVPSAPGFTTDTASLANVDLGWNGDGPATFAGPGTIATSGHLYIQSYYSHIELNLTGGVTWENSAFIQQDGTILFGTTATDSATLINQAGGTIDLTNSGAQILGTAGGTYSLINQGLLEDTGGSGTSAIQVAVDSTGTIDVSNGSNFTFYDGATFAGLVEGSGGIALDGGNFTLTASGDISRPPSTTTPAH